MTEARDPVRLGSIGLGWWGSELATAAAKCGAATVISSFARSEQARAEFASRHGCESALTLDELLADPGMDGVIIATSHQSHRELVEAAAAAGKHIFVEKPLATSVEDAVACVRAAERAGVVLQVGHQRRRAAANRRIRSMLDEGELGEVVSVVAHHSVPNGYRMPDGAWRWDPQQSPLGSMTSLGVHQIDNMHYLVGPISRVGALSRAGRGRPIDEATVLAMEFENGSLATLTTSFFTPVVEEIALFATEAAVFNGDGGRTLHLQKTGEAERRPIALEPVDPLVEQLADFAGALRGETTVETDGRVGLAVVAVLEAAIEATHSGRFVDVSVPVV
jgi:predicted dehydrogenase